MLGLFTHIFKRLCDSQASFGHSLAGLAKVVITTKGCLVQGVGTGNMFTTLINILSYPTAGQAKIGPKIV